MTTYIQAGSAKTAKRGRAKMKPGKLYTIRMLAAGAAYVVTLLSAFAIIRALPEGDPLRIPLALLPVPSILFGVWTFMQYLGSMDELERKIQLEAIGFSIGLTGVVTFTLGLLESAGFPTLSIIWTFPMMVIFWGFGQIIAKRKYE